MRNRAGVAADHSRVSTALPVILRRAVIVLLAGAVTLLLGAGPAWAHTELESSTPAADADVADAPAEVTLTFTEDIPADRAQITVTGPDGTDHATDAITGRDGTLTVPLQPLGAAGAYTIEYRVVSDDGHPIAGTVPFTLTSPGPGAATAPTNSPAPTNAPAAAPDTAADPVADTGGDSGGDGGGAPVWPWLLAAVAVLGGGVAFALRRAKS